MSDRGLATVEESMLAYLQSLGRPCSHAELADWAATLSVSGEELDRALVCADRSGRVKVDVGEPPGTATRIVSLVAPD